MKTLKLHEHSIHTEDTMETPMKLRVHIAPVGFELDRITIPAKEMRADKVWLIGHSNFSEDDARPFLDKVQKILKKNNIEVKVSTANRFKLFDIVKTVKEIIFEEKENKNEIYLNVASGSKIHSVGLMMACMIFDERSDIHPFYAQAKQYLHTKVTEPQTKGIKEIHHLPTYQIMTPKLEHLLALKIIKENGGKMKKKDMAEKAEDANLITINARPDNYSQARFASLDKNIISPLEKNWKYIETKKVGRTRWIKLTDEGNYACEFLI